MLNRFFLIIIIFKWAHSCATVFAADRQIRHRACALKDTVHAIIREELDENFEKICEEIKESRRTRGQYVAAFLPQVAT